LAPGERLMTILKLKGIPTPKTVDALTPVTRRHLDVILKSYPRDWHELTDLFFVHDGSGAHVYEHAPVLRRRRPGLPRRHDRERRHLQPGRPDELGRRPEGRADALPRRRRGAQHRGSDSEREAEGQARASKKS
jgi:hypothetical protein